MNQLRLKGYIHDVSAAKKSRVKSFPYFVFALQVDESLKRRAVCYDISKHKVLKTFQQSREPVVFHNVTQKQSVRDPSEDDIIVNKRSRVDPANNNDIQFEYAEPEAHPSNQFTTVQDIIRLDENQLTCVKGILTLRPDSVKQIPMKDGYLVSMLERCTVSDDTGTCRLTLWGTAIQEVANHKSYSITDVRVKIFNSTKYLTSTPATTFTIAEESYEPPSEEDFSRLFDAVSNYVPKILLADSYKTWLACVKCGKQVTEVTTTTASLIKCAICSTVQPRSSCHLKASVRIQVQPDDNAEPIWLKVFTSTLQTMLEHVSSDVTLQSPEEQVFAQLFLLKNFFVDFNEQSLIVEDVRFK